MLTVAGILFSTQIIEWIAPGFDPVQKALTCELFNILLISVVFQSLSSFLTIFYHVENRFFFPAIYPIITPIVSIAFVTLLSGYGIKSLAIGTLTGSAIGTLFLGRQVAAHLNTRHFIRFTNTNSITVLKLAVPLFVSGIIYRLTTIIERIIASKLPPGSISFLGYGNQIYLLLASIASGSIATTLYPAMSTAWSEGNRGSLNHYSIKGIRLILFTTLPIAAVTSILSYPIVKILFERGAFDNNSTIAVSTTLSILMGALIFGSLGNIVVKLFYITRHTTTVAIISTIEIAAYALMGYFLSALYSYQGLALALTLSTGLTIFLSVIFLARWKIIEFKTLGIDLLKLSIAAIMCGLTAHLTYETLHIFSIGLIPAVALSAILSLVVYLAISLYVLRFQDSDSIVGAVRNFF